MVCMQKKTQSCERNWKDHFDGLVQDRSNSIALAMGVLRSCAKPLISCCHASIVSVKESYLYNLMRLTLQWLHNGHGSVSNHQPHNCLLNRLFRRKSKKTSKLRVTGLCAGNSPGTGELPAQMASNAENISICWRHHVRWEHEASIF